MAIANDWKIEYDDAVFGYKAIHHVDGVLSYDTGTGTQPSIGEYILGSTSGAIGKVIGKTGDEIAGTLDLTNVVGQFVDGEALVICSELNFDAVTAGNGGFKVGDTIVGNASASTIVVKAIEYNLTSTDGWGTIYGSPMSAAFTDNEQLDISGGQADVADADGAGTDNDVVWDADVNGTLAVPGTANTNDSVIVHYDGGTIDVPEDAKISDAVSGAEGYAQRVYGATATGSIRVVNSDTTGGAWTNNNTLRILDCLYYDNLVAGKVFSVGDVVVGSISSATGRVLAIIDDGDSTGKLILANKSGTWNDTDELNVGGVKIAEVENTTNKYLDAATINIPDGVRDEQLDDQGGVYPSGSLNIVRSSNALYTYLQDTFDELGQLDDNAPVKANFKDLIYTLINSWVIPDLSFRFLEKGAWQDENKNNIFTNFQSILSGEDVGAWGFYYSSSNPTPQPNLCIEQDGGVLRQDWLEGTTDVLIKTKTKTDPAYINGATPGLGQLINSGTVTVFCREFLRAYDHFQTTTVGGLAPIPLAAPDDLDNASGTHQISYTGTGGFTVGEEIRGGTTGARGIVVAEDTDTNKLDYVLKTPGTQFGSAETITGQVSAATCTFSSVADLVAGYDTDIKIMTIDRRFTGGTTGVGDFIIGEQVNQAVSGWQGYVLEDDDGTIYCQDKTGTANGTNELTGQTSGATNTPTAQAAYTTVPKDLGDGNGDENYTAVVSADITDADPQTVNAVYEWMKYVTSKESTSTEGGPGSADGVEGRIYRGLDADWTEVKVSPYGSSAGGKVFGAQGVFIDKDTLDSADIQNFQLINNADTTRIPPNLQTLKISNLENGVRAAAYRSTGSGNSDIMRNEFKVGAVGGGYNQATDTKILVAANTRSVGPLPQDVPESGVLRVLDPNDTGKYLRFPYDTIDRTNNWFELSSGDIGAVTGEEDLVLDDNVHVCLIEEESTGSSVENNIIYIAPGINLYCIARKKGKIPYDAPSTFGPTGATIGAVLSDDDIVDLP